MTITLSEFRRQADLHGICSMSREWDKCASNKQRMDLALSIRGIGYIAKAIHEGWGISPEEIVREFRPFLNGRYIYKDPSGYDSAIYCEHEGEIDINTTAALVIACKGDITLPEYGFSELHIVGSDVSVKGGMGRIYSYGSDVKILSEGITHEQRI